LPEPNPVVRRIGDGRMDADHDAVTSAGQMI
jgi:hypothetical protein